MDKKLIFLFAKILQICERTQADVSKPLRIIPVVSKSLKKSLTETVVADDIHRNSKEDDDKEEDMNQINMSKYGYGDKDNMLKDGCNEKYG